MLIRRAVIYAAALLLTSVVAGMFAFLLAGVLGAEDRALLIGLAAGLVAACLCAFPFAWLSFRRCVASISQMREMALMMASGRLSTAHADEAAPGELGELAAALNSARDMIFGQVEQMNKMAHYMIICDLTKAHADDTAPGEMRELAILLNRGIYELSKNICRLALERNSLAQSIDGLSEGIVIMTIESRENHSDMYPEMHSEVHPEKRININTNPVIKSMFGTKNVSVGLPDKRMKHIPDKKVWEAFDQVLETHEPIVQDFTIRDRIIHMVISPTWDDLHTISGVVGQFIDITQSEHLERTRREYVSNVSHELRTPLTAMRALIEPLKEGMVTTEEDRQRYYDIILREVLRLTRLINDQLELSRLQSGGVAIQKQYMELNDLIFDVCDRYHVIAEEHGLELHIDNDLNDCPKVYSNPDRVEQMLIILLDNAIKYTEKGSVGVGVKWDQEMVYITVHDTGIGISAVDQPYVFDRFYKVDKAHSGKGSGLGLSIAKELLNRMEENIWVDSIQGEGSAFTFTLHRNPTKEKEK